jgi:hypothetical protein
MAGSKIRPDDKGKVRIRFMEVELEGSNETLLEGIRSITAAMPSQARIVHKQLPTRAQSSQMIAAPAADADASAESDPGYEDVSEEQTESVVMPEPAKRARVRAPKAPALSENLRLDEQPMPFRSFCDTTHITAASSITDKAIVVATWLKEHRQQALMSASDLFTCCKFMDWEPPTDVTSPMRKLKGVQKMSSPEPGAFTLTLIGDKHFRSLKK